MSYQFIECVNGPSITEIRLAHLNNSPFYLYNAYVLLTRFDHVLDTNIKSTHLHCHQYISNDSAAETHRLQSFPDDLSTLPGSLRPLDTAVGAEPVVPVSRTTSTPLSASIILVLLHGVSSAPAFETVAVTLER